jgi:hypothetical protein
VRFELRIQYDHPALAVLLGEKLAGALAEGDVIHIDHVRLPVLDRAGEHHDHRSRLPQILPDALLERLARAADDRSEHAAADDAVEIVAVAVLIAGIRPGEGEDGVNARFERGLRDAAEQVAVKPPQEAIPREHRVHVVQSDHKE